MSQSEDRTVRASCWKATCDPMQPTRNHMYPGVGVVLPETGLRARLPSSLGLLPWALDTRASLCVPRY